MIKNNHCKICGRFDYSDKDAYTVAVFAMKYEINTLSRG